MKKLVFLFPFVSLPLLAIAGCTAHSKEAVSPSLARLAPATGTYFGVNLDWEHDSAAAFNQRLGIRADVYVIFSRFPFDSAELNNLNNFIDQVAKQQGLALVTLEPRNGLNTVTPS